ncbi:hypothetical protein GXW83_21865 [Streptacidiphilus sp. PB12-B1b]|uniref:hypothetical protein n=1 Tax=Streptacidiphilus sp. PB12-B1b TaxID=2705012 RepID=UPI0015FD3703|nr:hypothetical protein [Streptacidiphilus sp. PB12-B1b]QMU77947.1 hypothetical protein GXW83_21865 [Streptacidiphilus sp. PB12-B1b]
MSELDELLLEVSRLSDVAPSTPSELVAHLARLKKVAARWADLLLSVAEVSSSLGEARTAAAVEIAFQRAEQSFVELEIAHSTYQSRRSR